MIYLMLLWVSGIVLVIRIAEAFLSSILACHSLFNFLKNALSQAGTLGFAKEDFSKCVLPIGFIQAISSAHCSDAHLFKVVHLSYSFSSKQHISLICLLLEISMQPFTDHWVLPFKAQIRDCIHRSFLYKAMFAELESSKQGLSESQLMV